MFAKLFVARTKYSSGPLDKWSKRIIFKTYGVFKSIQDLVRRIHASSNNKGNGFRHLYDKYLTAQAVNL